MTLASLMKSPGNKFAKIVKSAIRAANKDQKAVLDRYNKIKKKTSSRSK